jgi:hypothetical protein
MKQKSLLFAFVLFVAFAFGCDKQQPTQTESAGDKIPVWLSIKGKVILDKTLVIESKNEPKTVLLPEKYWLSAGALRKANESGFVYIFSGSAEVTHNTGMGWSLYSYGSYGTDDVDEHHFARIGVSQNDTETNDCYFMGRVADNGLTPVNNDTPNFYLDAQTGYRTTSTSGEGTGVLTSGSFDGLNVSVQNNDDDESIFIFSADIYLTVDVDQ